jgi:hypothetical protein
VSSEVLSLHCRELVCVDDWREPRHAAGEPEFRAWVLARRPNVRLARGRSPGAAAGFPDGSLDLVYIDGSHDEASARADVLAWRPKLRPGGWLAGHDYTGGVAGGGVVRAVDDLLGGPDRVFSDTSWVVRERG